MPTRNVETFSSPVNGPGHIDANAVRGNDNVLGQRINATTLDVRRFGAIGNGTADDTDALLSALASGEEIIIPWGLTFLIDTALTTTADSFSLVGRGKIKLAPNTNSSLLYIDDQQYAWVDGVEFDGNVSNQTAGSPLVSVRNGAYGRLQNLRVHHAYAGGVLFDNYNQSSLADELNLANSFIFDNGTYGLKLSYSGAPIQGTGDCNIGPNNHINYNGTVGIWIRGGSANTVHGNNILTNGSHGILIEGVPGETFASRMIILGNQCRNNGGSGAYANAAGTVGGGAGLQFIGNQFHYNNRALGGSSNLDVFDTDDPVIVGNTCGDTDFTPRSVYGLQIARVSRARITANNLRNNATGTFLSTASTYTSRGNIDPVDAG